MGAMCCVLIESRMLDRVLTKQDVALRAEGSEKNLDGQHD